MATWDEVLAEPPPEGRGRELWLQHVAGHILMKDVRRPGLEAAEAGDDAAAAVEAAVYGLMQVADGVTGAMKNERWMVQVQVAVQLVERSTGEVAEELDLADGDGVCMGFHGWIDGDFGEHPVTEPG